MAAQLLTCSFLVQYVFPSLPENLYWGLVLGSQDKVVLRPADPRSPTEPVPQAPALWIETTAYALLHLLLREGKGKMADKAASWLTHQGNFHGAFRSTQDTVVTLDALSAYWIASHTTEEKVLKVTLSSMGRNGLKTHVLHLNNHQVKGLEEELKFSLGSTISVKVEGNSKGTLKTEADPSYLQRPGHEEHHMPGPSDRSEGHRRCGICMERLRRL